ncbi:hypothetical protein HHI36_023620 [Cryptolaemus montrouzieri]
MGDLTTIHSISTDIINSPKPKDISTLSRSGKEIDSIFTAPPSRINPSNLSLTISFQKTSKAKLQKPSSKKYDSFLAISVNHNVSKDYPLKETSVINQNITEKFYNMSDDQINASFAAMNMNVTESNVTYFGNETNFNESKLLNSERIGIEETEDVSGNLSAAGITGISLGCVVVVGIFCSVSYFLYHNRGFNRPQVLNDRCSNPDSSGYLDDASVRDNSEEMYSLDNDSFLNSLEAMTIQNYWTDTVKHTKL